jgi:DNA-binding transcriptional regulator YdaS (Cro superfamily)
MKEIQTPIEAPKVRVDRAIEFAGSKANLSRLLGIDPNNISIWIKRKRQFVPPLHAYKLVSVCKELSE